MFKNNKGIESIIGVQTETKGDIKTKGTIRIDGTVEGTIEADWIILGESGHFIGDITTRGVIVGGKVEGRINADESIELKPKGHIIGDVTTSKLIISEGGILEGHSIMHRGNSTVVKFQHKKEDH
jgi:cytoskeletal protein CcmA (bactofilin family)